MNKLDFRARSGFFWSFVDQIGGFLINFTIGILIARRLSPSDFGLFSISLAILTISEVFINSGFSSALIRKGKNATELEYSSVFYFNLLISLLFALIFFLLSPGISNYFNQPILNKIIKVLSVVIVIDSISIIQIVKLTKYLDFKLQTKISILSSLISGIIAISLAYSDFGLWALVIQKLIKQCTYTILIWKFSDWRPLLKFSIKSISEMYTFSGKLFFSSIVNIGSTNLFIFFLGKYFTVNILGFYNKAQELVQIPSKTLSSVIERVSYPILSDLYVSQQNFKIILKLIVKRTMFLSFFLLFSLASLSEPIVLLVLGQNWRPIIVFLQLLCFVNVLYPLHSINLTMLKVLGRSDLFFRLELVKVVLVLISVCVGFWGGIKFMLFALIIISFLSLYFNTFWNKKLIDYSMKEQLNDIAPSFTGAIFINSIIYLFGALSNLNIIMELLIQVPSLLLLSIIYFEVSKNHEYSYFKYLIIESVSKKVKFKLNC